MPRAPTSGGWLTLVVLTLFWGSAFMFNAIALESFSPSMLVAVRITVAAVILFLYMRACGIRLPEPGRRWLPMLVMAILGNVLPFQLIAWAQQHIASSLAGALFLDEALSSWAYAGLALILSGIALSEAGPGVARLRRRLDRVAAQQVARERA
jgi:drug/metabolite transporter (DMT)-like permease